MTFDVGDTLLSAIPANVFKRRVGIKALKYAGTRIIVRKGFTAGIHDKLPVAINPTKGMSNSNITIDITKVTGATPRMNGKNACEMSALLRALINLAERSDILSRFFWKF